MRAPVFAAEHREERAADAPRPTEHHGRVLAEAPPAYVEFDDISVDRAELNHERLSSGAWTR